MHDGLLPVIALEKEEGRKTARPLSIMDAVSRSTSAATAAADDDDGSFVKMDPTGRYGRVGQIYFSMKL